MIPLILEQMRRRFYDGDKLTERDLKLFSNLLKNAPQELKTELAKALCPPSTTNSTT